MNAFLWTTAGIAAVNTALVIWFSMRGDMPPVTATSRALDAIITASMGAWALWLLAKAA